MVIIDIESNISLGGLTLDPAGMHCPSWDDAFVSSSLFFFTLVEMSYILVTGLLLVNSYGGVEQYLESIGFTQRDQQLLRQNVQCESPD